MQDYTNQIMELRHQIRSTDDPADRQALEDELDGVREDMKTLTHEQQNEMLREAIANSGITDSKQQTELIKTLRESIKSPFFMEDRGFGGGNFGGGGRSGQNGKKETANKAGQARS